MQDSRVFNPYRILSNESLSSGYNTDQFNPVSTDTMDTEDYELWERRKQGPGTQAYESPVLTRSRKVVRSRAQLIQVCKSLLLFKQLQATWFLNFRAHYQMMKRKHSTNLSRLLLASLSPKSIQNRSMSSLLIHLATPLMESLLLETSLTMNMMMWKVKFWTKLMSVRILSNMSNLLILSIFPMMEKKHLQGKEKQPWLWRNSKLQQKS